MLKKSVSAMHKKYVSYASGCCRGLLCLCTLLLGKHVNLILKADFKPTGVYFFIFLLFSHN